MACTIDHLRVDQRVVVLRDFTDLAGVVVRAGEAAVVRGLGLDLAQMEIWIELERGAVRERLRFALRATDGPRNGHMKAYFEVVEASVDEPVVAVPVPAASLAQPERERAAPVQSVRRTHDARRVAQAPHDTDLGERRVACDCDAAFHRDLLSARGDLTVAACLSCAAVTCSRTVGDDGRFTGDGWQKNIAVALPDAVHAWIGGWPRVKVDHTTHVRWPMSADLVRYRTLHYPADLRCDDLARLAEIEAELAREQAGRSWGERLRATQRVAAPPPAGVPEQLRGYELLWHALQLTPQSDVEVLLHHAQLRSPGSDVAAELVRARPDVFDIVAAALRSDDATRRGAGFAIARDWRPVDPRIEALLVELLEGLSLEPLPHSPMFVAGRGRGEMLLLLIAELHLATPNMLAVLRALMRTLARHDDFLTDCVRIVVRELNATSHSNP